MRFHGDTFVYYNGPERQDEHRARLRNFLFGKEFVAAHVLDSLNKAETHRLGFEMSEDALSWNVFVALQSAGRLDQAVRFLIGRSVQGTPTLYLWGCKVELGANESKVFPPLAEVRRLLEPDIAKFWTEPDIMLVFGQGLIVCIEAKFGSGNPLTSVGSTALGGKPKDVEGLQRRYLGASGVWAREKNCLMRQALGATLHSQLFRNIVFAARMAENMGPGTDWHIVNLVSSTQWKDRSSIADYDFQDPTPQLLSYLAEESRHRFTFRDWEGLYSSVVKDSAGLGDLKDYFLGKSAHFRPAFSIG